MNLGPQLYVGNHYPEVKPISEKPQLPCKPDGGMWTSTYDEDTGSGWVQWCYGEHFNVPKGGLWQGFLIIPNPDARIIEIDTYRDCEALFRKYEVPLYPGSTLPTLDFLKIREDYDAIHLTEEGQWRTRLTHPYNLYGWDCECTLWLREAHQQPQSLGFLRFRALEESL